MQSLYITGTQVLLEKHYEKRVSRRIIQEYLLTKQTEIDGYYLFAVKENDLTFVLVCSVVSPLEMYHFLNHFISLLGTYFSVSESNIKYYFDLCYKV